MRQWTSEERQRQAELIHQWKPWRTAGVKTAKGKARSRMNAFKHEAYSAEVKQMERHIRECRRRLRMAAF
ncbi:MAG: hypothetical protein GEU82_13140 [Luteitalea sp.]|nr:hypothetical protein [Luteitalea sp.]